MPGLCTTRRAMDWLYWTKSSALLCANKNFCAFCAIRKIYKLLCSGTMRDFNFSADLPPGCLDLKANQICFSFFRILLQKNFERLGQLSFPSAIFQYLSVPPSTGLWENSVTVPKKFKIFINKLAVLLHLPLFVVNFSQW